MIKEYIEEAVISDVKYHSIDELEPGIKMIVKGHELICFFPGSAVFRQNRKYKVKWFSDKLGKELEVIL